MQGQSTFQHGFGPAPFYAEFRTVQQTSDGGFFLGGGYSTSGSERFLYMTKSNVDGALEWSRVLNEQGSLNAWFGGCWMDDGVVLGGQLDGAGASVVKFAFPSESIEWALRLPGHIGQCLTETLDGSLVLLANAEGSFNESVTLCKIATNGSTVWSRTYGLGSSRNFVGRGVHVLSDGGMVIAGASMLLDGSGLQSVLVMRVNAEGEELWTRLYSPSIPSGFGYDVCGASDQGFVVVGRVYDPFQSYMDHLVLRIDPSGDTLWTRRIEIGDIEEARAVTLAEDGGFVVAGYSTIGWSGEQASLFKMNSEGDPLWARTYGGTSPGSDRFYDVLATADGSVVATGVHSITSYGTGYLVKTDAEGHTNCHMEVHTASVLPMIVTIIDVEPVILTPPALVPGAFSVGLDTAVNVLCTTVEVEEMDVMELSFELFPNPAGDLATLRIDLSEARTMELEVRNTLGQLVYTEQSGVVAGTFQQELDLGHLPAGVYTATVSCQEQRRTRTFVRVDR